MCKAAALQASRKKSERLSKRVANSSFLLKTTLGLKGSKFKCLEKEN